MDIVTIVSACIFFLFAVFGKVRYSCIVNPITVFCGLWGLILFAYSFHAYGMYTASNESLFLVIIGTAMFFFGAISASLLLSRQTAAYSTMPSIDSNSKTINYTVLFLLNAVVFAFLVGFGSRVIAMLLSGRGFAYIHRMYNYSGEDGILGASSINRSIVSWVVWPVMHASLATLAVSIQCDNENKSKLKKLCIIVILANLGLFTLISGKRSFMVDLLMYFAAVYFMRGKRVRLRRRTKFAIIIVAAIIVWAFNSISEGRGTTSFLRLFYVYIVGCIPHLSIKLHDTPVEIVGLTSIYGFFHAPITIINTVLHSVFLSNVRSSMSQLVEFTQQRASIGPDMTFNAFLTPFYYFYLDGGWIGNIIFSYLFGAITVGVYHNYLKRRTFQSVIVYLLVFFSLYMSMVRIQFFQMRYVLAFFYVLMISGFRVKFTLGRKEIRRIG